MRKIEARSKHTDEQTTGAGKVRQLKPGSAEWARAIKSIMGDDALLEGVTRERRVEQRVSCACKHCKDPFMANVSSIEQAPEFCHDDCKRAYFAVKTGRCPQCMERVEKTRPIQIFCGAPCGKRWREAKARRGCEREQKRLCKICGGMFQPEVKSGSIPEVCSDACAWERRKLHLREKRAAEREVVICAIEECTNEVIREGSDRKSRYCCEGCRVKSRTRAMRRLRGMPEKKEYPPKICEICGCEYEVVPQAWSRSRTCEDAECKRELRRLRSLGEL